MFCGAEEISAQGYFSGRIPPPQKSNSDTSRCKMKYWDGSYQKNFDFSWEWIILLQLLAWNQVWMTLGCLSPLQNHIAVKFQIFFFLACRTLLLCEVLKWHPWDPEKRKEHHSFNAKSLVAITRNWGSALNSGSQIQTHGANVLICLGTQSVRACLCVQDLVLSSEWWLKIPVSSANVVLGSTCVV